MVGHSGGSTTASLRYDPLARLYEVVGSDTGTTRFLYDGDDLVAEYNANANDPPLRRYIHGDGAGDDPLVWFEGGTVADSARHYLYADERGSIVAMTDSAGNVTNHPNQNSHRDRFQGRPSWAGMTGMGAKRTLKILSTSSANKALLFV